MSKCKLIDKVKHKRKLSIAPLDLCLKKELILEEHYRAATFFAFLYKVRYGAQVKLHNSYSVFLKIMGISSSPNIYNEDCLVKYSVTFHQMTLILKKIKAFDLVCDICVFDITPKFLRAVPKNMNYNYQIFSEYKLFRTALSELAKYLNNKRFFSR